LHDQYLSFRYPKQLTMPKKILLLLIVLLNSVVYAQMGGNQKILSKRHQAFVDSLKNTPYPFVFPILGDKVRKRGFTLPLPHGVMVNYLQGSQLIDISGLYVGFNNGSLYDMSNLVTFKEVKSNIYVTNVRVDTWVLPFLDIYGLAGISRGDINISMSAPFEFNTSTNLSGTTLGIGGMLTGAVGPVFIASDHSYTWNLNNRLDQAAKVYNTGLRIGPIFKVPGKDRMNIVLWGGFGYSTLSSGTKGSIDFSEVFPSAGAQLDEVETKLDNWYAKAYAEANAIQKPLITKVYNETKDGINKLQNGVEAGSIQYQMDKSIHKPFNVLLGAQWQINDSYQARAEYQFVGGRKVFLLSANIRFGIKGKTLFSKG
jgi:hypothetical protein